MFNILCTFQLYVLRTQFSWLVGWTGMLVVLKCVSWRLGELCVIDHGHLKMLQLYASSWDFQDGVNAI